MSIPSPQLPSRCQSLPEILNRAVQIKQGTVFAHCEVVRDLTAFGWRKPIFGPLADYQRMLLEVLGQEWAIVSGVSESAAMHEIDVLLRKCRSLHEQ